MSDRSPIPVVVNGAAGKMGREVVKAIAQAEDMMLVGAVDLAPSVLGQDSGEVAGCGPLEVPILNDLQGTLVLATQQPIQGVMVDFTHPDGVFENVRAALAYGVRPVVGTTGLSDEQLSELSDFAEKASTGAIVAPNFSIGVVLMQEAAVRAACYFDHIEIVELHHDRKADAPSGTAIKTAQMLSGFGKTYNPSVVNEREILPGARGALAGDNVRLHSVRLPGLIAHQEIIIGAPGQIYTLRHDTTDRAAFMPGVLLSIRKVTELKSLVYGLEKLL
ncbi:dihydrodipicolinate reductase [Rubidibacter lacunae KORDI 51-2]|uniref:4-hydroxy-tetrahydrodipicolinate reductase n=1 Tax=Rubidibacter lacunae KORDI 51-2 TaxID=582515 RepID=U5DPI3_9CHRO|nr:4-hydroxy-tetrahydrodipicolinate reductase [Rubidibacter lacunae]ERN42514.1 dihydrodipicolinate reductase [Rubidibacter lacunae KORDI 51-2]